MKSTTPRFNPLTSVVIVLVFALLWMGGTAAPSQASLLALPAAGCTAGPHSGEIATDQTWCAADNPHLFSGEVTVAAGVTLTIEPGAIVQGVYEPGYTYSGMHILGRLEAVGTVDQPILFTSSTDTGPEQWRGLGFDGSAAAGNLQYVMVRYGGMYHSEVGSFAEVAAVNVGAGGLTIEDSQVLSAASGNSGRIYGISVDNSKFSMTRTTVSGMGNASDDGAMRIIGAGTVATVRDSIFTGNVGTTLTIGGNATATISHSDFHGNWLAMSISGDNVLIEDNAIYDNTTWLSTRGGIRSTGGNPTIVRNILRNNSSDSEGAISIGAGSPLLVDNVIIGNHAGYRCSAIYISANANPVFKHTTIAGNDGGDGSAICMFGEGVHGQFYNTIIANEPIGVKTSFESGNVEMNNTLWDNVPIRLDGGSALINNMPVYGQALFDLDGYHLTRQSAAIGKGAVVGVTEDIDGEARPLPQGTLPDLGADEFAGDQAPSFWIEFYDEDPRLEATASGGVRIQQDFYIFWNYGSEETDPPELPVIITDVLGEGMAYETQEISGSGNFSFQQNGQTLTWQTQQLVAKDQYGFLRYRISYQASVQAGDAVDNTVHVITGPNALDQTITTKIPNFTPKITWPIDGENCSGQFVNMVVNGYAIPGSVIKLYEDGVEKAMGGANEEDGLFSITYNSEQAGVKNYTQVTVKSCSILNPYDCSNPSNTVTITKQTSFWCPKRSWWEGDYKTVHGGEISHHLRYGFRDNDGKLATEKWAFFAGTGLLNSTLSLHLCICPGRADYPTSTWVVVNGTKYNPAGGSEHIPTFSIPSASGAVEFHGMCGGNEIINHGTILVDPDGFIFDVTQGFDPNDPAKQYVLPGATVTLMVDEPDLGGWVQWPAHLYENQVNPQVTGADGYFAFYTPPGHYYLQVSGKDGFQTWRSPVITVVDKLVHVNVPLTPISNQVDQTVNLTVSGPARPMVFLNPGDTLEWLAETTPEISTQSRQSYTDNPVLHPISALDPLTNTLGWDGGMMAPGQVYQRRFDQQGVYSYDNGLGYTGQVLVGMTPIYLPLVRK